MRQSGPFIWPMMTVMVRGCQLKWTFFSQHWRLLRGPFLSLINCPFLPREVSKKVDLLAQHIWLSGPFLCSRTFYYAVISKQVDLLAQHMRLRQSGPFLRPMMTVMLRGCHLKWTFFLNIKDCGPAYMAKWTVSSLAMNISLRGYQQKSRPFCPTYTKAFVLASSSDVSRNAGCSLPVHLDIYILFLY